MDKKIIAILCLNFLLNWPYDKGPSIGSHIKTCGAQLVEHLTVWGSKGCHIETHLLWSICTVVSLSKTLYLLLSTGSTQ